MWLKATFLHTGSAHYTWFCATSGIANLRQQAAATMPEEARGPTGDSPDGHARIA